VSEIRPKSTVPITTGLSHTAGWYSIAAALTRGVTGPRPTGGSRASRTGPVSPDALDMAVVSLGGEAYLTWAVARAAVSG